MKLSNACMAGIVNILNKVKFPNPYERQRAYKAMRNICEQTVKSAKAKSVHEMFRSMRKRKVTLRPVKAMCKKLYSGKAENYRRNVMERMVMEWKEDDARDVREKTNRKLSYDLRAGSDMEVLNKYNVTNSVKKLVASESENELKRQRDVKKKKVKHLTEIKENEVNEVTHNKRRITVNNLYKTVNTADREIPESYSREPRIYGGAKINNDEKATLQLPPKFTVYEKINKQKCNVEIECMVSKYLWSLRKEDESNDENETSECTNATIKEVSDSIILTSSESDEPARMNNRTSNCSNNSSSSVGDGVDDNVFGRNTNANLRARSKTNRKRHATDTNNSINERM